jgi:predicted GNAT family acetyltransferase
MDDNFKHRLKNWVDKREAQNRVRMKDITHVVDPGRIIPKESKEEKDHNYYGKKIREYVLKRLQENVVNKSEELDKGAKGDWQKEGYTIRHFKTPHGVTVEAYKDNEKVGYLEAAHSQADKTKLYPIQTVVDFDHQRKGLATAMYQHAEKIMEKPFRPGSQSKEARALWGQKKRPFGKP